MLPWLCPAHPLIPSVIYKLFRHLDPLEEVTLACSAAPSGCHAVLKKWHTRVYSQLGDHLSTPITLAPPASSPDMSVLLLPSVSIWFSHRCLPSLSLCRRCFAPPFLFLLPPLRVSTCTHHRHSSSSPYNVHLLIHMTAILPSPFGHPNPFARGIPDLPYLCPASILPPPSAPLP